jgi:hypothetical protein
MQFNMGIIICLLIKKARFAGFFDRIDFANKTWLVEGKAIKDYNNKYF